MNIEQYSNSYVRKLLKKIIDKLDELDEEDYFGTEGWERFFDVEE